MPLLERRKRLLVEELGIYLCAVSLSLSLRSLQPGGFRELGFLYEGVELQNTCILRECTGRKTEKEKLVVV